MPSGRARRQIQFALFLAAFFAIWTARAVWLIEIDRSISSPEGRIVFSTSVKLLLWVVPAVLSVYRLRSKNPFQYLGISAFPSAKTWAICLLAIFAFCALILSFETMAGHKRISFGAFPTIGTFSIAAFFLLSPFAEEILFRGLVLKELSLSMGTAYANAVTSLLFVGIHLPYWISSGMPPQAMARTSLGILFFSLFAGWMFSLAKSVWPPTAAHIANNILSASFVPG